MPYLIMASLNSVSNLRRILNRDKFNNFITDAELQEFLDEANQDLYNIINRRYELDVHLVRYDRKGNLQRRYEIILSPLLSVDSVEVNDEEVNTSEYDIDLDKGNITFTEGYDLSPNAEVKIYSTPKIYESAELYLARYNVLAMLNNENSEGETQPIVTNAEKTKDNYINRIHNKPVVTSYS